MTAQAAFQSSDPFEPPIFNWGALFPSLRQRAVPKWRYEPPSLSNIEMDAPNNPFSISPLENPNDDVTTLTLSPEEAESSAHLHIQSPNDCFHEFKEQLALVGTPSKLTPYTHLLHTFNTHRPSDLADACQYGMLVFRYLYEAQWQPSLIVALFASEDVQLPGVYTSDGLEILQTVESLGRNLQSHRSELRLFYRKVAGLAQAASSSNDVHQDISLRLAIRGLWGVEINCDGKMDPSSWALLHTLSSKLSAAPYRDYVMRIFRGAQKTAIARFANITGTYLNSERNAYSLLPSEVLEFLPASVLHKWASTLLSVSYLRKLRTSNVRYHVRLIHLMDYATSKASTGTSPLRIAFRQLASLWMDSNKIQLPQYTLYYVLMHCLRGYHSLDDTLSTRLHDFIELYMRNAHALNGQPLNESLSKLVMQLSDLRLPNHGVLELMVPLVYKKQGLISVLDLLQRIAHEQVQLSSTAFLGEFVANATRRIKQQTKAHPLSTERDRQRYIVVLATWRELRKVVVKLGAKNVSREGYHLMDRQAFAFILGRAQDAGILPLSFCGTKLYKSLDARLALISQLALQSSLDRSRTPRQSWRFIYTLYKYLRRNNQAVGTLFADAVVRACLMRPLAERSFVSARRLQWVLRLVEEARGQEAARRIELEFWQRRGALISHAKRKLEASGGYGKVHVRTMKRLGLL